MRIVVVFCLLTIPMMTLGWPSPWVVVCSAFAAGFLARRRPARLEADRRPGYVDVSNVTQFERGPVERVREWTGEAPFDPQAFGVQLERPTFGDCEGCGGR